MFEHNSHQVAAALTWLLAYHPVSDALMGHLSP